MESGTTIIGIVLLLIFALPLILLNKRKSKQGKQFSSELLDFASKNNGKISEQELWNNTALGIDKETHQLFFIRNIANSKIVKKINLLEVQKCRIVDISRTVKYKGEVHKVVERLELGFTLRDKSKPEVFLEFYNSDHDSLIPSGELQLVEKWLKIVDAEIAVPANINYNVQFTS